MRLRPNDYRLNEVGPRAVDLAVIESFEGDRFVPVQWEGRLELVQNDDRSITFPGPALDGCDGFPALESSIAAYRIQYPIPARSSKSEATSFSRVMAVDLWLPEGIVAHTYVDTASMVDELAHRGLARGTLIYLLGWNAPYDSGYPRYQYADALCGEKGFSQLVEVCWKHGVEIMLHLNFLGYDPVTELLPDYEKLRVLNAHGTAEDWSGRLRSGFTNSISYIRVDDTRWSDLFFSQEHRRKIGGLPHVRSSFGDKTLDSLSLAILAETDG